MQKVRANAIQLYKIVQFLRLCFSFWLSFVGRYRDSLAQEHLTDGWTVLARFPLFFFFFFAFFIHTFIFLTLFLFFFLVLLLHFVFLYCRVRWFVFVLFFISLGLRCTLVSRAFCCGSRLFLNRDIISGSWI